MPTVRESSQPELEGGEARLRPDGLRGDLVDGDAVLDVGARGLLRMDAGQERGPGAGMVAAAVAERVAVMVGQSPESTSRSSRKGSSGLQDAGELEVGARSLRRPVC